MRACTASPSGGWVPVVVGRRRRGGLGGYRAPALSFRPLRELSSLSPPLPAPTLHTPRPCPLHPSPPPCRGGSGHSATYNLAPPPPPLLPPPQAVQSVGSPPRGCCRGLRADCDVSRHATGQCAAVRPGRRYKVPLSVPAQRRPHSLSPQFTLSWLPSCLSS